MSSNGQRLEDYQRAMESMGTVIDVVAQDVMTLAQRAEHFARQRINETFSVTQIMSKPVRAVHPQTLMSEAAHLMVMAKQKTDSNLIVSHDGKWLS